MGAFDGLNLYRHKCTNDPTGTPSSHHQYFQNQPSFRFHKGFGIDELRQLVSDAVTNSEDTVWVPRERPSNGRIGLSTWYAKALITEYFGVK